MTHRMRARLRDPGFLALARSSVRQMLEHRPNGIDGDDVGFYALLALEADSDRPDEFKMGSLRDLAAYFGLPEDRLRRRVQRLVQVGWIEWTPARNSETPGLIRLLVDVEHRAAHRSAPEVAPPVAPQVAPRGSSGGDQGERALQRTAKSEQRTTSTTTDVFTSSSEPQSGGGGGGGVVVQLTEEDFALTEAATIWAAESHAQSIGNLGAFKAKVRTRVVPLLASWRQEHPEILNEMSEGQIAGCLAQGDLGHQIRGLDRARLSVRLAARDRVMARDRATAQQSTAERNVIEVTEAVPAPTPVDRPFVLDDDASEEAL